MIKNKKILIIGKNSFIAGHLLNKISSYNKIFYFNFSKSISFKNLEIDSKKLRGVIIKNKLDFIINFHAHTDVEYSFLNPNYDFYHNSLIHRSVIDVLCRLKSSPFYLFFGTCTQVGYTNIKSQVSVTKLSNPETIFDLHKQYNEDYLKIMKSKYKIKGTSLRLSNIFGTGNVKSKSRGIISTIISNAYKKGNINLYGDGKFIRDILYIDDLISGIIISLKNSNKLNKHFYYLTSGKGYSFKQLAENIKSIMRKNYNKKIVINFIPWPNKSLEIDKRSFIGNPNEFKKITGWQPKYGLKKAIENYLSKSFKQ